MLSRLSAAITAATITSALGLPAAPAAAATCAAPLRYAAEAGSELAHVTRLDARPLGGNQQVTDVPLAATRTGMVAQSPISAAAAARLLGARRGAPDALIRAVGQQAPPDNAEPTGSRTDPQTVGALALGAGSTATHARWTPGMACGATAGDAGTSTARLDSLAILADSGLVRVPATVESSSSTALQRRADIAHTVARAQATLSEMTLLDGQVTVAVVRQPSLTVSIASRPGTTDVSYTPPILEVRGNGFAPQRLTEGGDDVELALAASSADLRESGTLTDLPTAGPLPLPGLPARPGILTVPDRKPESAPVADGSRLRVSLGELRQRAEGHAVAARAVAVRVELTTAADRTRADRTPQGYGGGTVLDLDLGVLEAAAVAPDGPPGPAEAGQGGGLPVTGANVDGAILAGLALVIAGIGCLVIGLRRRVVRA